MTARNKNIPALRFKGFDSMWNSCTLGDVTQYTKGFAFKSNDYSDSGNRIIRVSDLGVDRIKSDNDKLYISADRVAEYTKYQLQPGNIIITTVGSKPELLESAVGRGIFVKQKNEGLLNQNLLKFENITGYDNGFIYGLINTKKYQLHKKGIARGNANQANITVVDLLQFKISIPSLPEQQKIASFLSAIDEKIRQLTRRKELLEQYKKGVMQQLFSGKLRFKDEKGKGYPKWEECGLGEHIKLDSGFAFKGQDISETPGGIPLMRGINITEGFIRHSEEIDRYYHGDMNGLESLKLVEGDLVLGMDGSKVGKNSALVTRYDAGSLLVQRVARIRSLKTSSIEFIYQHIRSPWFIQYVDTVNTSSGIPHISAKQIKDFKISFPVKEEQIKIASFLSSIDTKIESVTAQIERTQRYKKGLLQKMFV